jgi:hypothetical protein
MQTPRFHLAQLNIGRFRGPIDSPVMKEFADALDQINALAESSPGFVWRLKDDSGNATGIRPFEDPLMAVNLSVWESIETLKAYVYHSMHGKFFARRREWFEKMEEHHLVMWWIPAGTTPTAEEAKSRLALLRAKGDTPEAFTFRHPFPAPSTF